MVDPDYLDWYFQYQYYDWVTIIFNDPGYYQVISRASNACGATNWVFNNVTIENCYYFSMYPNPASDYVTITLTVPEEDEGFRMPSEFRLQIMDNRGLSHYSTTRPGDMFTLPVSHLRNGTYYVIITYGDKVESLPLVISK
ncbi:MAG: T9SS type A sorting domain-containing protein [Bacteroidales bacterium]|nr:T9SS type A sorting domain-containing protein [Bacteroidales bacterium]